MPADPVTVELPKHPLHALATFELKEYRRQLESAIAFFDRQDPLCQDQVRHQGQPLLVELEG